MPIDHPRAPEDLLLTRENPLLQSVNWAGRHAGAAWLEAAQAQGVAHIVDPVPAAAGPWLKLAEQLVRAFAAGFIMAANDTGPHTDRDELAITTAHLRELERRAAPLQGVGPDGN